MKTNYAIVFVDQESHLLKVAYQSTVRTIKFKDIAKNHGFLEQIMDFYKDIFIVEKHKKMEKEVFKELIINLFDNEEQNSKKEKLEQKKKIKTEEEKKIEDKQKKNLVDELKGADLGEETVEESTLVRSSLEGCLHIADLNLRFDTPAHYIDLAKLDQNKIKKSRHLQVCLQQGTLVKTTMKEIKEIEERLKAEEKEREEKKNLNIVDRKKIKKADEISVSDSDSDSDSDNDIETMEITAGPGGNEMLETFSNVNDDSEIVTDNGVINAGEIKGMFSNMFNKDNKGDNVNMDQLLKNT